MTDATESWGGSTPDPPALRRPRGGRHSKAIIDAAQRLVAEQGEFTTQELVAEAGVALQTFYRHFDGKDQLLVAMIEDLVAEQSAAIDAAAQALPDPVARLRFLVLAVLGSLGSTQVAVGARYITAQHQRLHQLYPEEITAADRPYTEMIRRELVAAGDQGLLSPTDPEHDAWLISLTVRSVYHHYAFAPLDRPPAEIAERVWALLSEGLGAARPASAPRPPITRPSRKPRTPRQ